MENLVSRIATLYNIQNAQFSTKKKKGIQRYRKVWPIHRKKIPLEAQILDLLDKDFKGIVKYAQRSKENQ